VFAYFHPQQSFININNADTSSINIIANTSFQIRCNHDNVNATDPLGQYALVHTILTQLLQRGRPRNKEATAETTTTTTAKPVIPSELISRCTTIGPWAMSFPPSTTTGTPQ